jgi:hypothetical protein
MRGMLGGKKGLKLSKTRVAIFRAREIGVYCGSGCCKRGINPHDLHHSVGKHKVISLATFFTRFMNTRAAPDSRTVTFPAIEQWALGNRLGATSYTLRQRSVAIDGDGEAIEATRRVVQPQLHGWRNRAPPSQSTSRMGTRSTRSSRQRRRCAHAGIQPSSPLERPRQRERARQRDSQRAL